MEVLTTRVAFVFKSCSTKGKPFSGITTMEDESITVLLLLCCVCSHMLFFSLLCPELLELQAGAFFLQFLDVASHSGNHPAKELVKFGYRSE
jgi:hypothetical protein